MVRRERSPFEPARRVLVVDADSDFRTAAAEKLRQAGYAVHEADGARAAMRAVLSGSLDVVVLDLMLPDGDGIEVARAFRAMTVSRDICVVAVTGHPASINLINPRTFGAEAILLKPVPPDRLLDAVAHCFGDAETGEFEIPSGIQPDTESM